MVNQRFVKSIAQMGRKELLDTVKNHNKYSPPLSKVDAHIFLPDKYLVPEKDLVFTSGDRVQILRGKHKNKVGQILSRVPNTNTYAIHGISERKNIIPINDKPLYGDQYEPVQDVPISVPFNDVRLVSKIRSEQGEEDVVIHSVSLGEEKFNAANNKFERVRYATNDPSIEIPWPINKPEKVADSKQELATRPDVVDLRTHYVVSAVNNPLPLMAVDQVTNVHNRFKRARYAKRITLKDLKKYGELEMPVNPKTRQMLDEIEKIKVDEVRFTDEMREFIGNEVERGVSSL